MAITAANSYLKGRIWYNCTGGGFTENYNLKTADLVIAQQVLYCIAKLRMRITEANTRVANAVVSVEQRSGTNPPDGLQIPHDKFIAPILMLAQSPVLAAETVVGSAADPAVGISWQLDTGVGFREGRVTRAIRSSWIQKNQLIVGGVTPNAPNTPALGTVLSTTYVAGDPGVAINDYFSFVRDNTIFVQVLPIIAATAFNLIDFAAQAITPGNGPDWGVRGISRRIVGTGWPKIKGRQSAFA